MSTFTCFEKECCTEESNTTNLILYLVLPFFLCIFSIIGTIHLFNYFHKIGMAYAKAKQLIIMSIILIVTMGLMSWGVREYTNPCADFN